MILQKTGGKVGDDDNWGTKDLNTCCGKMNVKIPSDIPAGDYLLRAEALALHTAGQANGAQFYMTCCKPYDLGPRSPILTICLDQITVSGGGAASPALVKFPGAYSAADPGIKINIHAAVSSYVVPGPPVYSGGTTKAAGDVCVGTEKQTAGAASPSSTAKTTAGHGRRHL
jgi:lytic cellulose monooxygenase (C1-hydroxylating)